MSRIDRLREMIEKSPEDADLRYMLAQEHANAGDHLAAIDAYDACIERDPEYLYAYYHQAVSLRELEDPERAAAVLETGLGHARRVGDPKAISEISNSLADLKG